MSWNSGPYQKGAGGKSGGKGDPERNNGVKNPAKTVWVGNVPEGVTFKDLMELAKQVGNPTWAEVMKKGSGAIGFPSEAEAKAGAASLNGAQVGHVSLQADLWAGKNKDSNTGAGGGGGWGGGGGKSWGKGGNSWGKGGDGGKMGGGGGGKGNWGPKIKETDKAVWVGGLPEGTTYQEILAHAKEVGNAKWTQLMKGESAAVGFPTAEEAMMAVVALNGSHFKGVVIQADTWAKKEKM